MLKSIKIKNFKSVQNIEIELGRVNVFIGENGCGKTTILEAISLASAAFSNKLDQEFLVSRGIRVVEPKLMKSAFTQNNESENITVELKNTNNQFIQYQLGHSSRSMSIEKVDSSILSDPEINIWSKYFSEYVESDFYKSYLEQSDGIAKADSSRAVTILLDGFSNFLKSSYKLTSSEVLKMENKRKEDAMRTAFNFGKFLIYTPENYFLRRFEEEGQINPIGVRGEGLFKHLVELFKEDEGFVSEICTSLKLINWFEGMEIPNDLVFNEMRLNIKDRFIKETIEYFDQRSANEGFLYLLFYFTLFLSKYTPDFFAIDNVDNALNPKLCSELIQRIIVLSKDKEKQIVLTTHNPSILDGLDLHDDDQRLFVIFRNSEGHTRAKRVKPPRKIDGIETVRLSEAFIRGYLGGLPKNF